MIKLTMQDSSDSPASLESLLGHHGRVSPGHLFLGRCTDDTGLAEGPPCTQGCQSLTRRWTTYWKIYNAAHYLRRTITN